jgi:hypothetical protein
MMEVGLCPIRRSRRHEQGLDLCGPRRGRSCGRRNQIGDRTHPMPSGLYDRPNGIGRTVEGPENQGWTSKTNYGRAQAGPPMPLALIGQFLGAGENPSWVLMMTKATYEHRRPAAPTTTHDRHERTSRENPWLKWFSKIHHQRWRSRPSPRTIADAREAALAMMCSGPILWVLVSK